MGYRDNRQHDYIPFLPMGYDDRRVHIKEMTEVIEGLNGLIHISFPRGRTIENIILVIL